MQIQVNIEKTNDRIPNFPEKQVTGKIKSEFVRLMQDFTFKEIEKALSTYNRHQVGPSLLTQTSIHLDVQKNDNKGNPITEVQLNDRTLKGTTIATVIISADFRNPIDRRSLTESEKHYLVNKTQEAFNRSFRDKVAYRVNLDQRTSVLFKK